MDCVITELEDPSRSQSEVGVMEVGRRLWFLTKDGSTKQCEEPQSISAKNLQESVSGDVTGIRKEFGSERADALSRALGSAQLRSTQSSACAEAGGLLPIFLSPRSRTWVEPGRLWL